jgi:hypothetical protein
MKLNRIIFLFVFVVVGCLLAWWFLMPPATEPAKPHEAVASPPGIMGQGASLPLPTDPASQDEERKAVLGQIETAFRTPIAFYGKVIDQYGEPVPHAAIGYTAISKFNAPGTGYSITADESGNFEISEVSGIALSVGVKKNGYYNVPQKSHGVFAYGTGPDSYRQTPPTKENPAVFALHKMGDSVPLIHVNRQQIDVPPTGQAVRVNLATGRTGQGDIELSSAVGDITQRPFDWHYRLRVPGGGLIEREGQFDFIAPEDGYQPNIEVRVTADEDQWASRLTKEYFAKLEDGRFARFSIRFFAGRRNFVVLESYVDPEAGNRNLEFDPAKAIKP